MCASLTVDDELKLRGSHLFAAASSSICRHSTPVSVTLTRWREYAVTRHDFFTSNGRSSPPTKLIAPKTPTSLSFMSNSQTLTKVPHAQINSHSAKSQPYA